MKICELLVAEANQSRAEVLAQVKTIKKVLASAGSFLDHEARAKESHLNEFDKTVEWITQETDAKGSKRAAEDIFTELVDAGIDDWTVKVIGRDDAQGDPDTWKWQVVKP